MLKCGQTAGAEVTCAGHTKNIELIRPSGENHVIDYTKKLYRKKKNLRCCIDIVAKVFFHYKKH